MKKKEFICKFVIYLFFIIFVHICALTKFKEHKNVKILFLNNLAILENKK